MGAGIHICPEGPGFEPCWFNSGEIVANKNACWQPNNYISELVLLVLAQSSTEKVVSCRPGSTGSHLKGMERTRHCFAQWRSLIFLPPVEIKKPLSCLSHQGSRTAL
jgi:hypothetical protein